MSDAAPVGGLQRRLALEHEAVWLAALVAARHREESAPATAALRRHRATRDDLIEQISDAGATPAGAQAAYGTVPGSREAARERLAELEERIAAAALALTGVGDPAERSAAVAAVREAALAALAWGAPVRAFPGLDSI